MAEAADENVTRSRRRGGERRTEWSGAAPAENYQVRRYGEGNARRCGERHAGSVPEPGGSRTNPQDHADDGTPLCGKACEGAKEKDAQQASVGDGGDGEADLDDVAFAPVRTEMAMAKSTMAQSTVEDFETVMRSLSVVWGRKRM